MEQIAGHLDLSEKTVEFHKHHIMETFNLKSNSELGTLRPEAGSDFDGFQVFPASPALLISLTAVPYVTRVSPSCEGLDTEPNIGLSR